MSHNAISGLTTGMESAVRKNDMVMANLRVWSRRWRLSQEAYNKGKKSFNDLGATAIQYMDAMSELVETTEKKDTDESSPPNK